jgi:hypothetical protein
LAFKYSSVSFQGLPSGSNGGRRWIRRGQIACQRVGIEHSLYSVKIGGLSEGRFSRSIGPGHYGKRRYVELRSPRSYFTNDVVVLPGGRRGIPPNLKSPAVRKFHNFQPIAIGVENRTPGPKRLQESFVGRCPYSLVEFGTADIHA